MIMDEKRQPSSPSRNIVASISCCCGGFGVMVWVVLLILAFAWRSHWSSTHPASNLEFFTLLALGSSGPLLGLVGAGFGLAGIRLARCRSEGVELVQAWVGLLLGLFAVPSPLLLFYIFPWRQ